MIEFAKTYYPDSYNDFNEASLRMMFIEMAAMLVMFFHIILINNFKKTYWLYAQELSNVYAISQAMGYRPRGVAHVLELYN